MAKKQKKKGRKSTRNPKAAVGEIKRVRTRHAPDGTPVPMDSNEGITISEEWVATEGLPDSEEVVFASNRREALEIAMQAPPPDGAKLLNEAIVWANGVLAENDVLQTADHAHWLGLLTDGEQPSSHSQVSLAYFCHLAFQVVALAIEKNNTLAAAHWAAFCTQQYEIARFKREEETLTVRGTKSTEAGRAPSCRNPALVKVIRLEAKKRWDKEPELSAHQLADELERRYLLYTKSTIRRFIAPDNPNTRQSS